MKKEDIENALSIIKQCCEEADDCRDCPFDDGNNACSLGDTTPKYWDITVRETYKVLWGTSK